MKNSIRWDHLTSPEIRKLAEEKAIVLVPVGSTEQHGPHLPVGTDALLATLFERTDRSGAAKEGQALCGHPPRWPWPSSTHHMSFAGSLTLKPQTYLQMIQDYCESIAAHGSAGSCWSTATAATGPPPIRRSSTSMKSWASRLFTGYSSASAQAEREILETQSTMIHACEEETSLILAMDATLVDPVYQQTKGNPGYGMEVLDNGVLETFHRMEAHTENGVMGNAYAASVEKGQALVQRMTKDMADVLEDESLWDQKV